MMGGPNFDQLEVMRRAVRLPVIASGGVCSPDHVRRLRAAGVYGCIVGRALYEGQVSLPDLLALARAEPGPQAATPSTHTTGTR
jgi:phosphoribosylformimino-5-aminoimidazole carboxamide ribotide isomerase